MEKATFGAGCFWCVEAVFQRLKGVHQVVSGYMGGKIADPSYREVCSGLTGHAEVIQITYDSKEIDFNTLLEVLWISHDPTTLNRQGNDVGTQYRSVIFYHNEDQKNKAIESIEHVASKLYEDSIVTEISPASEFYAAEAYHDDYYNRNKMVPYCRIIISPKILKLRQKYNHLIKDHYREGVE